MTFSHAKKSSSGCSPGSREPATDKGTSVLILGLDGAGKVCSYLFKYSMPWNRCPSTHASAQTTFLENVKTQYTKAEGIHPDKIGPTVGLNSALHTLLLFEYKQVLTGDIAAGKITLPSTILHFQDLGE